MTLVRLPCSGPIQWARGNVGLEPSAAARPWALACCEWRAAAPGLKPLRLPRAQKIRGGRKIDVRRVKWSGTTQDDSVQTSFAVTDVAVDQTYIFTVLTQ